jgi:uncharacterized protein (TIGR00255 family)
MAVLLSMTGHGDGHTAADGHRAAVEIRTVNSRYFHLNVRGIEFSGSLESRIEEVVRQTVRRGTVNVTVRMQRPVPADAYRVNEDVLATYQDQLDGIVKRFPSSQPVSVADLLALPGVIEEPGDASPNPDDDWPLIEPSLREALHNLQSMRATEGRAMTTDLIENTTGISTELGQIEQRSPLVVEAYRARLTERLNQLLAKHNVTVTSSDVVREVGLFSERCDIAEEIVRLRSHLEQFRSIMAEDDSVGRKLEFVIQEMVREVNTIGSKANDAEIARCVVDVKSRIERMREMVQNIE